MFTCRTSHPPRTDPFRSRFLSFPSRNAPSLTLCRSSRARCLRSSRTRSTCGCKREAPRTVEEARAQGGTFVFEWLEHPLQRGTRRAAHERSADRQGSGHRVLHLPATHRNLACGSTHSGRQGRDRSRRQDRGGAARRHASLRGPATAGRLGAPRPGRSDSSTSAVSTTGRKVRRIAALAGHAGTLDDGAAGGSALDQPGAERRGARALRLAPSEGVQEYSHSTPGHRRSPSRPRAERVDLDPRRVRSTACSFAGPSRSTRRGPSSTLRMWSPMKTVAGRSHRRSDRSRLRRAWETSFARLHPVFSDSEPRRNPRRSRSRPRLRHDGADDRPECGGRDLRRSKRAGGRRDRGDRPRGRWSSGADGVRLSVGMSTAIWKSISRTRFALLDGLFKGRSLCCCVRRRCQHGRSVEPERRAFPGQSPLQGRAIRLRHPFPLCGRASQGGHMCDRESVPVGRSYDVFESCVRMGRDPRLSSCLLGHCSSCGVRLRWQRY